MNVQIDVIDNFFNEELHDKIYHKIRDSKWSFNGGSLRNPIWHADNLEEDKFFSNYIQELIKNKLPLFGICLGHQMLALALGAKTKKMKLGHRGANHPVKNLIEGNVEITSQNHGFEVVKKGLPKNIRVTHQSLFDNSIEGIELKNKPVFSVQYHPESNPGPQDSVYLFDKFVNSMKKNAKKKKY